MTDEPLASDNLAIDSIVPEKRVVVVWEEIDIKVYTRGSGLSYGWSTNHGTLIGEDSVTVRYWACPTCTGLNTIECKVSNEYGTVSDTVMIKVL
ncbi:MAG: hypothetical protein A2W93_01710 [Bacteroidetes bacterium GWF2_43_63]|nr:MAG: hypothetical protein A2W94_10365 [Bacteroidetes bacterium GWE2_42_42]OFY55783.1 MAG: hypothetical protein A2W93_01710 [Bacteroidetes bacterium GWF2_43_63]HBG71300.1 hypothetical protein [Bacteroidales bacterium]HCB60479.1 hypothetical protein [Bacteroidales bacterium]HCY22564.1 hypothetical protein [Bacteroidales bacterium]